MSIYVVAYKSTQRKESNIVNSGFCRGQEAAEKQAKVFWTYPNVKLVLINGVSYPKP